MNDTQMEEFNKLLDEVLSLPAKKELCVSPEVTRMIKRAVKTESKRLERPPRPKGEVA